MKTATANHQSISSYNEHMQNLENCERDIETLSIRLMEVAALAGEIGRERASLERQHKTLVVESAEGDGKNKNLDTEIECIELALMQLDLKVSRRAKEREIISSRLEEKRSSIGGLRSDQQRYAVVAWKSVVDSLLSNQPDNVKPYLLRLFAAASLCQNVHLNGISALVFGPRDPEDSTSPAFELSKESLDGLRQELSQEFGIPSSV